MTARFPNRTWAAPLAAIDLQEAGDQVFEVVRHVVPWLVEPDLARQSLRWHGLRIFSLKVQSESSPGSSDGGSTFGHHALATASGVRT